MKLKPVLFLAIIGAVAAASVTAWATIPDSTTGAVTMCANKYGTVRVIDAQVGKKCKRTEKRLTLGARGATGPAGGAPALVVQDANGALVGSLISYNDEFWQVTVLGDDGHFRRFNLDGSYSFSGVGVPARTSSDCTGDFYVYPGNEQRNPFGMISRFWTYDASGNPTGTVDLIESTTTYVDSSQIRSIGGAPGPDCYSVSLPAGTRYYKFVAPTFLVGPDLVVPLKIVPAP